MSRSGKGLTSTTSSKDDFINGIQAAIYSGCGINPLVGSGASAGSGIIMGKEFADYLAYVVHQALEPEDPWDLRQNGWPAFPTSEDYKRTREWTLTNFKSLFEGERYHIEEKGPEKGIRSIQVLTNDLADQLDCPSPPQNIRASDFTPHEASIRRVSPALQRKKRKADWYEPLWTAPNQSPTSARWLLELGLRSLSDWRATLRFLSRLVKDRNGRVRLSRANGSVIDRFNTFITADRQPNLTHKMLAALARPLRTRTVLTTNFDTLTEEAFGDAGHALKKFFVSRHGRLPDPFLVRAQPSIIKLHGELLETRADHSLDDDPDKLDKRRFLRYGVDVDHHTGRFLSTLSHVLVIGFSGTDVRIIRMLQHMLDETARFAPGDRPKIFWICASGSNAHRVNSLFANYPDRVVHCTTDRPDLLLLEIYQKVTRALPGAGHTYEYNHNVPPRRVDDRTFSALLDEPLENVERIGERAFGALSGSDLNSKLDARDGLANVAGHVLFRMLTSSTPWAKKPHPLYDHFSVSNLEELVRAIPKSQPIHEIQKAVWNQAKEPRHLLFFNATCGALESLSILHAKLNQSSSRHCLWFELADYLNADSLLRDILRSIALRTGRFQREHVSLHPLRHPLHGTGDVAKTTEELARHLKELCRIQKLSPADWPILMYGRDLAGSCVSWNSKSWDDATWRAFPVLLGALAIAGFPVLVAHSCQARLEGEAEKNRKAVEIAKSARGQRWNRFPLALAKELDGYFQEHSDRNEGAPLPPFMHSKANRNPDLSIFSRTIGKVFERCLQNEGYRRFIYAICLFRQSRRPSALFYEAVQQCDERFNLNGIDNDIVRADRSKDWVQELENERIFYIKAGGTSWMHRDIRIALRTMLDHFPVDAIGPARKPPERLHLHSAARTHFWIGDWYEKAFNSTGFAKPLIEALHHYYQAARLARHASPKELSAGAEQTRYRVLLMRSGLNAITKLLITSRPNLKLWMANPHGFPMFEPLPNGRDEFRSLLTWMKCEPIRNLNPQEKEELAECYRLLRDVLEDTQRAIESEANIEISTDVVPSGCVDARPHVKVQESLVVVTKSIYESSQTWREATRALIDDLATHYGGRGVQRSVFEACFPVGGAKAIVAIEEHARNKGMVVGSLGPDVRKLPALVAILEAIAYAQMRRAKFCGHVDPPPAGSTRSGIPGWQSESGWQGNRVRGEWLRLTRLCNLGIDWCKHLSPAARKIDAEVRIRLQSYYAVALANLDRFYEAHRHLNEAFGILAKLSGSPAPIEHAKLTLRRAEVFMTEAHRVGQVLRRLAEWERTKRALKIPMLEWLCEETQLKETIEGRKQAIRGVFPIQLHRSVQRCLTTHAGNPDAAIAEIQRLLVALLDDAWFAIENAERALSGHSQSSLWWGRIALMKLRACGYHGYLMPGSSDRNAPCVKMLAYRHRRINPQGIWQLFQTARLNNQNSRYREFRLVRYVTMCLEVFWNLQDDVPFVKAAVQELYDGFVGCRAEIEKDLTSPEMKRLLKKTVEGVEKLLELVTRT